MPADADVVAAHLRGILRSDQVVTGADERDAYAHDDAEWAQYHRPLAVVLAETTRDVAAVVRYAAGEGLSVVARGAGTGLSGGANALEDAIVLSLERMTRVLEVNAAERYVIAEAGVINDDLRTAVAAHGLWYPPDPASYRISTIGGNAATNAGGICCVKYGVTRDYVLGMTVVLADGETVRLGRRTAKGATGYDLTALMVGSEAARSGRSSGRSRRSRMPESPSPRSRPPASSRRRSSSSTRRACGPSMNGRTWAFRGAPPRCCCRRSTTRATPGRGPQHPSPVS
jgi:glycolate oxidase